MKKELRARLLTTFIAELDEQAGVLTEALLALERDPADGEQIRSVFRAAHTIKGAARILSLGAIEAVCHALEDFFAAIRDARAPLESHHFAFLFRTVDALGATRQQLAAGEPIDEATLRTLAGELQRAAEPAQAGAAEPPAPVERAPPRSGRAPAAVPVAEPAAAAPVEEPAAAADGETIRVAAGKLDSLQASAGELTIAAARLDERLPQLQELRALVDAWVGEWRHQRPVLRKAGALPGIARDWVDQHDARLERLRVELAQLVTAVRNDTRTLGNISGDVGGDVRALRLRPITDAFAALPRAVRDVAAAAGKQVELEIDAGDVEADRLVVDALREPLLHLVRNAIDHGIETPAQRQAAGKPEQAKLQIRAQLAEGRLRIKVHDDGGGLDVPAIRERMRERGDPVPESDRDVARALLAGGVTTRGVATAISGRGVGLDIVRSALARIRGSVDVRWSEGRGTTFILESPPSPTTLRVVLVSCSDQLFALPDMHVERLLRVTPDRVRVAEGRSVLISDAAPIPLVPLAAVLGPPLAPTRGNGVMPVVLLGFADRRLAIVVDSIEAELDIVIRPLEGSAARVPHIGGGALLPSGRVALLLHVPSVITAALQRTGTALQTDGRPGAARGRILVVDDSITTRALEQSLLEAAGYDVVTAVDGVDGWRQLQELGADLVVADIEMPRMDGFELCRAIRRSDRFARLPVVLVTGLEAPEHRARGLEVGADAYLAKSAFDQEELLDIVRELLD